jgi:hypothetical protein
VAFYQSRLLQRRTEIDHGMAQRRTVDRSDSLRFADIAVTALSLPGAAILLDYDWRLKDLPLSSLHRVDNRYREYWW